MKVQVRDEGAWRKVLEIEVPHEDAQSEFEKVVEDFQKKASIPGFRKGKVPKDLLEARFGHSFHSEFMDAVIPKYYREALNETKLVPIKQAEIADFKFEEGEPLSFKATVEVWPDVEVAGYDGIKVTRENHEISADETEKEILRIQEIAAQLEPVERAALENDFAVVDFVRLGKDGKPIKKTRREEMVINLSAPTLLPDFKAGLAGASAGDEKVILVNYPGDFADKSLAGQAIQIQVKVREIKERVLPKIDDDFARNFAGLGNLDELRSRIRLNLEGEEKLRSRRDVEERIIDELIGLNSFELPSSMISDALEDVVLRREKESGTLSDEEKKQVEELFRPHVIRNLKKTILISSLGRKESLEVNDEEMKGELEQIAKHEGKPVAEIEKELTKEDGHERLRNALFERKVLGFLVSRAVITEVDTVKPAERLIQTP